MIVTFFHSGPPKDYLRAFLKSVREVMDPHLVQMTDEETAQLPEVDEVIRRRFRGISRTRIEHLANYPHDEMLHLDTDIIVKNDPSHVFDKSFDVALTKRVRPVRSESGVDIARIWPYNSGVMFSRSRDFWKDCVHFLDTEAGHEQSVWGGEQLAPNVVAERGKYDILDLPCDLYNWTPWRQDHTSDAYIWHYKGGRKAWMLN